MPIYLFQNPETDEVKEVVLGMNDPKVYQNDGVNWVRLFTIPNAAIDTQVDPHSAKDFVKATNKKGTIGDLFDRSAELSEKRKEKIGHDPLKEKYYENYSKTRKGKKHPDVIKREKTASLKKLGITLQ
jgi:hypothetical protein